MEKSKQALHELLPLIISSAEVAAEKCGCLPEDILLATINLLQKRKWPLNKVDADRCSFDPNNVKFCKYTGHWVCGKCARHENEHD